MNINKYILFYITIILLQSCTARVLPGLYSTPLGPRMIQPIPQNGNVNALPQDANFVQSYPKYKKSKANGKFGPLVRIIEFEYDIADTFSIRPRLTSGFDEGEMTGLITIILDQYELTYENKLTQIREYVEEVSYETDRPVHQTNQVHTPASTNIRLNSYGNHSAVLDPGSTAIIQKTQQKKLSQVVKRSQLYNSTKYSIEDEDVALLLRSKSIIFVVHLQNAEISIYPSKEQIRILRSMILEHYSPVRN